MRRRLLRLVNEPRRAGAVPVYCRLPFSEISIGTSGDVYPNCCPDWVDFPLGNLLEDSWADIWNGPAAQKLRESMLDGSACHCDAGWCPHLQNRLRGESSYHVVPLAERPQGGRWESPVVLAGPEAVGMHYDDSCNLACPTCRSDIHSATGPAAERVRRIHEVVERDILPSARRISLTGTGDPFASSFLRSFLTRFDHRRYPALENIHLHTNAIMWTPAMWAKMPGLHEAPISTDVSIDAATASTYEVVRWPATWDRLLANLEFILSLPNVHTFGISMTVSQLNYREILRFQEFGEGLARRCPDKDFLIEYKRARRRDQSGASWRKLGIEHLDRRGTAVLLEQLSQLEEACARSTVETRSNLRDFAELT